MDTILVSVIVPAYNAEGTINNCIGSIIDQSYQNIEVLIVDDGSIDKTISLVRSLEASDERIRLVQCSHKGVVSARRTGIRKAKGDYIAFVDSDDTLDHNAIECLVGYAIENQVDLAVGCSKTVTSDGSIRGGLRRTLPSGTYTGERLDFLYRRMIYDEESGGEGVIGAVWGSLFRKDVLINSSFAIPERLTYGEDAAMIYLSLLEAKRVYLGDDCVYYYYRHSGSASTSIRNGAFDEIKLFYSFMMEKFNAYGDEWNLVRQLKIYLLALLRMAINANFDLCMLAQYDLDRSAKEIMRDKSVVIYGAGAVGKSFFLQLTNSGISKETWLCDARLAGASFCNEVILSVEESLDKNADYFLIANNDPEVSYSIGLDLQGMGVDADKIVKPLPSKSELQWNAVIDSF